MNNIFVALTIALMSFLFQVRPRFKNRYFGIDTWRHLAAADYIRKFRKLPGVLEDKYLIKEPADYPPVLRVILAFLPKNFLAEFQWIISPFFDFFHSLFIFWAAFRLSNNLVFSAVAQMVYSFAPLVVMENSNLTTRSLASLLFSVSFYCLIFYDLHLNFIYLGIAVLLIAFLFLTHRMAIQALLVACIAFSVYSRSLLYLAVFLAGAALAVVFSGGFYLKILKGHIAMLRFWGQNIHHRYAHQVKGLMPKGQKSPDMVFRIYQAVKNCPSIAVFGANPFVLIALLSVFILKADNMYFYSDFLAKLHLWCAALFIFAMIVRHFKFIEHIGEGERYLEYAGLPVAILCAATFTSGINSPLRWLYLWFFLLLFVFGDILPALFLQQKVITGDTERSVTPELREMFGYINSLNKEARIMTFPLGLADMVMYFTKAKVLSTDSGLAHLRYYSPFFPVLKEPLEKIFKIYDINYVLVNEKYCPLSDLKLDKGVVEKKTGIYSLINVASVKE